MHWIKACRRVGKVRRSLAVSSCAAAWPDLGLSCAKMTPAIMGPRSAQMHQDGQGGPRRARTGQDEARIKPRWAKMTPRWGQDGANVVKMNPRLNQRGQNWPRWGQDGANVVKMNPRLNQKGPCKDHPKHISSHKAGHRLRRAKTGQDQARWSENYCFEKRRFV